ncbi:MAG TPA: TetR/AcrR family transcriptional regulator [Solirubrobacterales bacterium]|nr:TetR/AcrR family transcriptional regulator [Solirubrobacterales bacterium]
MAENVSTVRPSPGRHPLSREFIARHQRARIISALAEETVEKGYRAVTVADIVRRAGIARNTFYENFSSKEDCFLAAAEFGVNETLRQIVEASGKVDGWPARVNAGLAAFLRYVASDPALARLCVVEALSAGPASVERYEESVQSFLPLFRMGRKLCPHGEDLPGTLEETIIGGIFWIVYQRIIMGQAEQIEELRPELVEFSLAPYLGAEAAKRVAAEAPPLAS